MEVTTAYALIALEMILRRGRPHPVGTILALPQMSKF